jgi:hypothetical protein
MPGWAVRDEFSGSDAILLRRDSFEVLWVEAVVVPTSPCVHVVDVHTWLDRPVEQFVDHPVDQSSTDAPVARLVDAPLPPPTAGLRIDCWQGPDEANAAVAHYTGDSSMIDRLS